jgi:hypothetical protein
VPPKLYSPAASLTLPPLVFYFAGTAFPRYALLTLKHSVAVWGGKVVMLHDGSYPDTVKGVISELFRDWYEPDDFTAFVEKSPLDPGFRDGFWFHTAERLFVINQWAEKEKLNALAHAELDVLLFSPVDSFAHTDSWGKGIFYPAGTENHAGASFIYLNERRALTEMLEFFVANSSRGDEMRLLWDFLFSGSSVAHQLPSHTYFENRGVAQASHSTLTPAQVGGLFDVQPLGTWILGQDPRNTPKAPHFNHIWLEQIGSAVLTNLRFSFNPFTKTLRVGRKFEQKVPIRALHVHSKKISWVTNPFTFAILVAVANFPFAIPLAWKNTLKYFLRLGKKRVDLLYLWVRGQRH